MFVFARKGVKFYQKVNINTEIRPAARPEFARIPLAALGDDEMYLKISPGKRISKYQLIAQSGNRDLLVYLPFDGEFISTELLRIPGIGKVPCGVVKTSDSPHIERSFKEQLPEYDLDSLIDLIRESAIVDEVDGIRLFRKLEDLKNREVQAVIAYGVDDQPYTAASTAVLLNCADEISAGINLVAKTLGCEQKYLCIKKNYRNAELFTGNLNGIQIVSVKGKYPCAPAVKSFCERVNGIMIGVQALRAIYQAAAYGLPQISVVVTVWGEGLAEPANIEVPFGTPVKTLLEQCQAFGTIERVIAGGIMTGRTIALDSPLYVSQTALTPLIKTREHKTVNCIGCGRCGSVCPAGLSPYYIMGAIRQEDIDRVSQLGASSCIGCGCCSYICPSYLPVTEIMKYCRKKAYAHKKEIACNA